jgi:hypothetical protein
MQANCKYEVKDDNTRDESDKSHTGQHAHKNSADKGKRQSSIQYYNLKIQQWI